MNSSNQTQLNNKQMKTKINPSSVDESPDLSGVMLQNRFRVTGRLNKESGEAKIYSATDTQNEDVRCIVKHYIRKKSIKSEILDKLSHLNEPSVVKIISYGDYQGYTYTVTPYYSGISLREYISKGGRFSFDELKDFIIPSIVQSLNIIHSIDIVHKDLKPDNIIMTEKNRQLVLIDFGISTDTNGRTMVVTNTGKTQFYSAPETVTGAYSVYSDYYSLGICLYELFTGSTPYCNSVVSEEDLARYAQIQKIPYPAEFPQQLMDLIDGLTYKDLSNRDDPNNPNRRWTYEEVQKWLKGEEQPVPGRGLQTDTEQGDFKVPYFTSDRRKLYSNRELADYFMTNWRAGIEAVSRGWVMRHYELNEDQERLCLCQQCEKEMGEKDVDSVIPLYRLLYQIGNVTELCWKDYKFDSLVAFGEKLVNSAVENTDLDLIHSVKALLNEEVLSLYIKNSGKFNEELQVKMSEIFNNVNKLITADSFSDLLIAQMLGYALGAGQKFRIGADVFENIDDFNQKMHKLYKFDAFAFVKYIGKHRLEIHEIKKLFSRESQQVFEKCFQYRENAVNSISYKIRNKIGSDLSLLLLSPIRVYKLLAQIKWTNLIKPIDNASKDISGHEGKIDLKLFGNILRFVLLFLLLVFCYVFTFSFPIALPLTFAMTLVENYYISLLVLFPIILFITSYPLFKILRLALKQYVGIEQVGNYISESNNDGLCTRTLEDCFRNDMNIYIDTSIFRQVREKFFDEIIDLCTKYDKKVFVGNHAVETIQTTIGNERDLSDNELSEEVEHGQLMFMKLMDQNLITIDNEPLNSDGNENADGFYYKDLFEKHCAELKGSSYLLLTRDSSQRAVIQEYNSYLGTVNEGTILSKWVSENGKLRNRKSFFATLFHLKKTKNRLSSDNQNNISGYFRAHEEFIFNIIATIVAIVAIIGIPALILWLIPWWVLAILGVIGITIAGVKASNLNDSQKDIVFGSIFGIVFAALLIWLLPWWGIILCALGICIAGYASKGNNKT